MLFAKVHMLFAKVIVKIYLLFTTWWGYTGGVKRVILTFLSYYSILLGITANFSHVTPQLYRVICHFYHVTQHFWRVIQRFGQVIQR